MTYRWRNRALVIAGILITAVSMHSIVKLSSKKNSDNQTLHEVQKNKKSQQLIIGWYDWDDARLVSLMAEELIETHYELPVKLTKAAIGIQYEAVAQGDIDLMLMAWLPKLHKKYWAKVSTRVLDLGPMYSGRVGWVVPDYVPKASVGSMSDLTNPNVASVFKGTVQGIDPGSGLMQSSKEALNIYELTKIKLVSASDAAMTAVLDQAIRDKQWVVVTGWTPHWMFARYQLRFLKDPKGVFGGQEGIHAIARLGLDKDHPKVVAFLTRFNIPDDQLAALLLAAQESSPEQAVNDYLVANPKRVDYWMNGTIQEPVIKADKT